tara:strand:- start:50361 stop:50609 length:249 start_codon:yes stop_codon:yes gene_type:complete
MTSDKFLQLLNGVVITVISDNQEVVEEWLNNIPGSWGKLAGQAIILAKRSIGRALVEDERLLVWNHLWHHLQKFKLDKKINI